MSESLEIPFTQYLMPDGRKHQITIEVPDNIGKLAHELIARGYRFEIEMLSDRHTISMTVFDPEEEVDIAIELAENGPAVPVAVHKLVKNAHAKVFEAAHE